MEFYGGGGGTLKSHRSLIGNTLGSEFVFSLFLEEQDWCSGERTRLPPMWPGFESCGWSFSPPFPHPGRFSCW